MQILCQLMFLPYKIQKQALIEKIDPVEIAYKYETIYFENMDALNVKRPSISCRATGHILEIIDMVKTLIDKGFAYVTPKYFSLITEHSMCQPGYPSPHGLGHFIK